MTERCFAARVEALPELQEFLEQTLEAAGCPPATQTAICVAMEELFANIVHYAYPNGTGQARLTIDLDRARRTATFVLTDTGIPFDPLARPDPDITRPAEQRQIGGLGIFIVKKTMDTVSYARIDGENRLTMTKKL